MIGFVLGWIAATVAYLWLLYGWFKIPRPAWLVEITDRIVDYLHTGT